jgi:thiamine biosynthesis lipoprotein
MNFLQKEIKNEIMATDLFICIHDEKPKEEIEKDLNYSIKILKDTEQRFSRFLPNNELSKFNNSSEKIQISDDLILMLEKALFFNKFTNQTFDISILQNLIKEGYNTSKKEGFFNPKSDSPTLTLNSSLSSNSNNPSLNDLNLNKQEKTASKPTDLKIDLGGIAKGYAVDKVSQFLKEKYSNFIVDVGGDIYASGIDLKNNYQYWAIDIENPLLTNMSSDTLIVSNQGIATSGVNRRKWTKDGIQKNHIIDPKTGKSISNNILSVTVISDTTTESDILAKSLLIMGIEEGIKFSEEKKIAAYFIDNKLNIFKSSKISKYVWVGENEK